MFGDGSWIPDATAAQHKRFNQWLKKLREKSARLMVIELGAGTAIPTVRLASESVSEELRANFIRINPREFDVASGLSGDSFRGFGRNYSIRRILMSHNGCPLFRYLF